MSAAIYSLQKLSLDYPASNSVDTICALRDITLNIDKNDFVGVVGPNGAGKSSLLQLLNGTLKPNSGRVLLSGQPLSRFTMPQLARKVATVAQLSAVPAGLSCFQVAAMGALPHKRWFERDTDHDRQQTLLALQQTGLQDKQRHATETLSGGETQRLHIARALVQQADILLLDEPTNHLDVQYQHQILQLLQQLDKTIVCCIHDLNLAARYCSRLLLLQHGQVLAYGTPAEVLTPVLLQQAFSLACEVTTHPKYGWLQVTFLPPNTRDDITQEQVSGC